MSRGERHARFLALAGTVSEWSTCIVSRFGAVVVTPDGHIIATGYNGAPRGEPECASLGTCYRKALGVPPGERYELCKGVHAEQNALLQAGRLAKGCTLYLSGADAHTGVLNYRYPCLLCSAMLVNAEIDLVVIRHPTRHYIEYTPREILRMNWDAVGHAIST